MYEILSFILKKVTAAPGRVTSHGGVSTQNSDIDEQYRLGISFVSYSEYILAFPFTLFHNKKMFLYSIGFLDFSRVVFAWLEGDGGKSTAISHPLVEKSFFLAIFYFSPSIFQRRHSSHSLSFSFLGQI
jgi:hypothetical protein